MEDKDKSIEEVINEIQALFEEAPVDFLGTGDNSTAADKEAKEWGNRVDKAVKALRDYTQQSTTVDVEQLAEDYAQKKFGSALLGITPDDKKEIPEYAIAVNASITNSKTAFIAGHQQGVKQVGLYSETDMAHAFEHYQFRPFPHNTTFQEWLTYYKIEKNISG